MPHFFPNYPKLKGFTLIEVMIAGGILLIFISTFLQISNQINSQFKLFRHKVWISENLDRWTTEVLWQNPFSIPMTAGEYQQTFHSGNDTAELFWRITVKNGELITLDFNIGGASSMKELSQNWVGTVLLD